MEKKKDILNLVVEEVDAIEKRLSKLDRKIIELSMVHNEDSLDFIILRTREELFKLGDKARDILNELDTSQED